MGQRCCVVVERKPEQGYHYTPYCCVRRGGVPTFSKLAINCTIVYPTRPTTVLIAKACFPRDRSNSCLRPTKRASSLRRSPHDLLLKWVQRHRKQNVRWLPRQEFHKISSTRSWITSPQIQILNLSEHALSYPDRGFHRAAYTSSTLPT